MSSRGRRPAPHSSLSSYQSLPPHTHVISVFDDTGRPQTASAEGASPPTSVRVLTQVPQVPQQRGNQHQERQRGQDDYHADRRSPPCYLRYIESNSGAAFARLLTATLESADQGSSPMRMLAWNLSLGERQAAATPHVHTSTIIAIIPETDMQHLAKIYLEKFRPCYGFVEKDTLFRSIQST